MERLERFEHESYYEDEKFCKKLWSHLGSRDDIFYKDVDALYFDYSGLPEHIKDKAYRDQYLVYGITDQGEFVSKWVERWELDKPKKEN